MSLVNAGRLKSQENFEVVEIEIVSNYISNIRRSLFKIITILLENEYLEVAKQLRRNIFYVLKVPQNNWESIFLNTPFQQTKEKIYSTYGGDIAEAICEINRDIEQVVCSGNPMNRALQKIFSETLENLNYVLFVESKYKEEISAILNGFVQTNIDFKIISTIGEYRDLNDFHTLFFIGSIRIDDYTSLPNYFLRNTKFVRLVQLKWSGQKNDYTAFATPITRLRSLLSCEEGNIGIPAQITNQLFVLNSDSSKAGETEDNIDEVEVYKKLNLDNFPALCFKLANEKAALYSPNSKLIIVKNESNKTSIEYLRALEAANLNTENLYIANFNIPHKYLNERHADSYEYQKVWKSVLMEQDFDSFLGELERAKIDLKNLSSCVSDWCDFSENVVKAPQEKENFLILLRCMKLELISYANIKIEDFELWTEGAWREILTSRGEAISEGLQHSSEYEELVYKGIKKFLKLTSKSPNSFLNQTFAIDINFEKCDVELYKIDYVELGYDAPKKVLKQIITTQESNFYR